MRNYNSFETPRTWTPENNDNKQPPTSEWQSAMAEKPREGKDQDCIVSMETQGVWAIFDGMGGVGSENAGQIASRLAAKACKQSYSQETGIGTRVSDEEWRMRSWLREADSSILSRGEMGTTAVAIRLVEEEGRAYAVWANVGDSRLYLSRDSNVRQITKDEGHGHVLTNCLGTGRAKVGQVGYLGLLPGDKLMLCSDGITGDYDSDILTDDELKRALSASTPQDAANELLRISRKNDDKSVVVIEVPNTKSRVESSSLRKRKLNNYESYRLDTNNPLEDRGDYNIIAQINAGGDKELMLLDLRSARVVDGKRVPFGKSVGRWDADFLLVDDSFFGKWGRPINGQGGYRGVRAGETLDFGRYYDKDRFKSPDTVSREHFSIFIDPSNDDGIYIENREPVNGTWVTVKH